MSLPDRIAGALAIRSESRALSDSPYAVRKQRKVKGVITGDVMIDATLKTMHLRIQKKLARRASRVATKTVVLPEAQRLVPVDTGELEAALKVRALKRSRYKVGHRVVIDSLPSGRVQKPFAVEFGTRKMPSDSYLRQAIYSKKGEVQVVFQGVMRTLLREEGHPVPFR